MLFEVLRGEFSFEGLIVHILVILLMIFLILPVHEFAHAGVALLLGDKSIKYKGRLSLNPLRHVDIWGALCMLVFGFGWAKPVPVNPMFFKKPKLYMAITALAGPVSNILCGMLGGGIMLLFLHFGLSFIATEIGGFVWQFLAYYVSINVTLAVFNLIPIPPLDGSKVLFAFLPNKAVEFCYRYQQYSFILIYILLLTGVLDVPMGIMSNLILRLCFFFDPTMCSLLI